MADKKKVVHPPSRTAGLLQLPLQGVPKMSQGLLSYEPTLREKIANAVYDGSVGLLGKRKAHEMQANTKSAVDFVPGLGDSVGANDMARDARAGNYGMAALSAIGLIPAVGDLASKAGKKALANAPEGIRAFHGSPHSFDKFSLDKIGTGEGAQAYGHGLYFADNESVALSYRDALKLNGYSSSGETDVLKAAGLTDSDLRQLDPFLATGGDPETIVRDFTNWTGKKPTPELKRAITQISEQRPKGSMYEVNIRANPDDFLDWDKPLSEQSETAKTALVKAGLVDFEKNIGPTNGGIIRDLGWTKKVDKLSGQELYKNLTEREFLNATQINTTARKAAERDVGSALQSAGIPGIKYLDAGSRGAGDGSRNYVVFDEKLIDIVRKYGLASAIGAGIISKEMGQQMQAQGDI